MRRLAVSAHYDPDGFVAPHVRRHIEALRSAFDELVVVTTAALTAESRKWMSERARLIERTNEGYDFYSYKVGLESSNLQDFDEVAICNDTYVGPLRPYPEILEAMAGVDADFWGLAGSAQIAPHVQSFFLTFRQSALRSEAFSDFWRDMKPISTRYKVIRRYEVGLSRTLHAAGFRSATYFVPGVADDAVARRRVHWEAWHRHGLPQTRGELRVFRQRWNRAANPCIANADAVFDDCRLPFVKIDTLRYDPYGLNASGLLDACEQQFPDAFDGVREYLERTAVHYPARDELRATPWLLRPLRSGVVYRTP